MTFMLGGMLSACAILPYVAFITSFIAMATYENLTHCKPEEATPLCHLMIKKKKKKKLKAQS